MPTKIENGKRKYICSNYALVFKNTTLDVSLKKMDNKIKHKLIKTFVYIFIYFTGDIALNKM